MTEPFYITTPIYYVNSRPHIGHAYSTTLADVLNRYHRFLGAKTFFLTGTDEHGQKVAEAAQKEGFLPKSYVDRMAKLFADEWEKLGISYDRFIRTTDEDHQRVVQHILQQLHTKGQIYAADYEGWYCISCERYWTGKDVIDSRCPNPECQKQLSRLTEKNYFFRMSLHQDWLIAYIHDHPRFILPQSRRNEVLGFLRKPLGDLCISRPKTRLTWGIPLPFDDQYVTYVWFDALANYLTGIGYLADSSRFEQYWPHAVHVLAKDIVTTHCVYWPTILHALDLSMPQKILTHGWWTIDGGKMSKSAGNVVDPLSLADKYGTDAFRFFLIRDMILGLDSEFSEPAVAKRINTDLANDYGNSVSRVTQMICQFLDGKLPHLPSFFEPGERLRHQAETLVHQLSRQIQEFELHAILDDIFFLIREVNKLIDQQAPWAKMKAGNRGEVAATLAVAANVLRIVTALLHPVMPTKTLMAYALLSGSNARLESITIQDAEWNRYTPGGLVSRGEALFPRIEILEKTPPSNENPQKQVPATPGSSERSSVAEVSIDQFHKIELRVATVLTAERIPKTDKLLKLTIDIGQEKRQLVAGIAKTYPPESLIGKRIIVIANLAPAKIRGVESRGMLLAATTDTGPIVLTTEQEVPAGSRVG